MRTLRTPRCTLEPQVEAHAAEMFEVLSDPAIYAFERAPPPSPAHLAAGYRQLESRLSPDGRERWLNWVVRLHTGAAAGYVQATVFDDGVALVAYEFASRHWGRGLAHEAVTAMLDELSAADGVHTFAAVLKRVNARSMALLRRLGFEPGDDADALRHDAEADEAVMRRHAPAGPAAAGAAAAAPPDAAPPPPQAP